MLSETSENLAMCDSGSIRWIAICSGAPFVRGSAFLYDFMENSGAISEIAVISGLVILNPRKSRAAASLDRIGQRAGPQRKERISRPYKKS
jgi:hypothetical protein